MHKERIPPRTPPSLQEKQGTVPEAGVSSCESTKGDPPHKIEYQKEILYNRILKRYRHLRKWASRIGTNAYRLYDRDIPEIPLVLDFYDGMIAGALYERPYHKDEQEEALWLRHMQESVARALQIPEDHIFLRQRRRLKNRRGGAVQYQRFSEKGITQTVTEGGLLFQVNLSDYLDTGLFLDHRKSRAFIRSIAGGKRVLNLFCYTGAFSVYALAGQAASVDSVDLSRNYLEWAQHNCALNQLEATFVPVETYERWYGTPFAGRNSSPVPPLRHRLIRADVLRFVQEARQQGLQWDLIILDPPTFSNSKKMEGVLDIRRDHVALITTCLDILTPGGTLWFSTNARHFQLKAEALVQRHPRLHIKDLTTTTIDEDFRGKIPRRCYLFMPEKS
ncbi:MAG TPA: class I SAM-dependent methyltransferase [Termitinemataceae bacterium]|nr:class I SAM-dependent methyltransferase [Termitinemataceae bacterium]